MMIAYIAKKKKRGSEQACYSVSFSQKYKTKEKGAYFLFQIRNEMMILKDIFRLENTKS